MPQSSSSTLPKKQCVNIDTSISTDNKRQRHHRTRDSKNSTKSMTESYESIATESISMMENLESSDATPANNIKNQSQSAQASADICKENSDCYGLKQSNPASLNGVDITKKPTHNLVKQKLSPSIIKGISKLYQDRHIIAKKSQIGGQIEVLNHP